MKGAPYLKLRPQPDGSIRPRFEPGPRERALGFAAEDLRHDSGAWFTVEDATDWANRKAKEIYAARYGGPRPASRSKRRRGGGMVYFHVAGSWVKIGWSADPLTRMQQLAVGSPEEATLVFAVRAQPAQERQLHAVLATLRKRGEWFAYTPAVKRIMAASLVEERLVMPGEERLPHVRLGAVVANPAQFANRSR